MKLLTKYVDDIFAVLNVQDIDKALRLMNACHNKIQFTVEMETNKSLPYLDLQLKRSNNKIITNWYQKPTASGRMINYNSNQPEKIKFNTARNFIHKVLNVSNMQFHESNKLKIKKTLLMNNFPKWVINNLLNKSLDKAKRNKDKIEENVNIFYSVPYIP